LEELFVVWVVLVEAPLHFGAGAQHHRQQECVILSSFYYRERQQLLIGTEREIAGEDSNLGVWNLLKRKYVIVERYDCVSFAEPALHNCASAPLVIRINFDHGARGNLVVPSAECA
jgi:hypothetical protein